MGVGSRATKNCKYSAVKDRLEHVVNDASDHFGSSVAVMADATRWAIPGPARVAQPILDRVVTPPAVNALALPWASSQALRFHRTCLAYEEP